MTSLALLLLLLSIPGSATTEADALLERIRPLAGEHASCAAVYSRYASGRPRLVVGGTDAGDGTPGDLLLVRLPDTARGHGVVVHRLHLDDGVMELHFVKLIDARDVVASLHVVHPGPCIIVRIVREKLIEIAETEPDSPTIVDLDHDGVPEIVGVFAKRTQCG